MKRSYHFRLLALVLASACHGRPAPGSHGTAQTDAATPDADPTLGEEVEIKIDLAAPATALAALALTSGNADKTQDVWFYDTSALALFDAGTILRARKVHGGVDDATVKARPRDASDVSPSWLALPGAKCEVDRTLEHASSACSLTADEPHGQIDAVAAGAAISSLYTADQLVFLGAIAGEVDLASLARFGPIPSTVWHLTPPDLAASLAFERWVLPDGSSLLEVSTRVPHASADDTVQAMVAWLAAHQLAIAADQDSKTRAALLAFAP